MRPPHHLSKVRNLLPMFLWLRVATISIGLQMMFVFGFKSLYARCCEGSSRHYWRGRIQWRVAFRCWLPLVVSPSKTQEGLIVRLSDLSHAQKAALGLLHIPVRDYYIWGEQKLAQHIRWLRDTPEWWENHQRLWKQLADEDIKSLLTAWYALAGAEMPGPDEPLPMRFAKAVEEIVSIVDRKRARFNQYHPLYKSRDLSGLVPNAKRKVAVRKKRSSLAT